MILDFDVHHGNGTQVSRNVDQHKAPVPKQALLSKFHNVTPMLAAYVEADMPWPINEWS